MNDKEMQQLKTIQDTANLQVNIGVLNMAIQSFEKGMSTKDILDRAKLFKEFVKG